MAAAAAGMEAALRDPTQEVKVDGCQCRVVVVGCDPWHTCSMLCPILK